MDTPMDTTRLSKRGKVVILKKTREAHGWEPRLEFIVEEAGDSIKPKPIKPVKRTTTDDVLGCLHYKSPRKSLKDNELLAHFREQIQLYPTRHQ